MEPPKCKLDGVEKVIGEYTPMGPVDYSKVQQKIFEFQNYQNFLRVLNADKKNDYFVYPYPGRLYGGRKNYDDMYNYQQEALTPLLQYPITEKTVDEFEKGLKYFIKTHVRGKDRLYKALKTGFSGKTPLYKECVIRTDDHPTFGTYDTQLVRGNIEYFSPTINMAEFMKNVEVEVQRELNAAGGFRKTRSKKNRKTRRR